MNIKELVKQMTLEEKVSMCSGKNVWETQNIDRLNIPSIMMADGPHGLRKQVNKSDHLGVNETLKSTCFPPAVTASCSFDREIIEEMGRGIAKECILNDVDIILGPGVNIKRSPLCGRNFEYYSEDPFIAGEMGAAFVRGVESQGIGTCVKHYAANNQETLRHTISSVVDPRALREIYLFPFERIMKEKPYSLMCSYNKVNGVYASENHWLLNEMLRETFQFEGVVITDWGACNDRVLGLINGQDLEMPTSYGLNNQLIYEAVKNGALKEEVLDETIERLLNLIYKCKNNQKEKIDITSHHQLAKKIADESMVLLKNEDAILPIKEGKRVGIIGELARNPRYQGSGSSKINPIKLDTVYDSLVDQGINFQYASGYHLNDDTPDSKLMSEAISIARSVDVIIVFIGLTENYESEGFDREHMKLPQSHNELIEALLQVNSNIVVVLSGGAPVEMPWISKVKGLLNSYLGGESGAGSIIDILYGKVNPSGKLTETYPQRLEDHPSYQFFPGGNKNVYYQESIYVGYRYFDKKEVNVLFPFGYGLSYTTFLYHDLKIEKTTFNVTDDINFTFKLKNTGTVDGKEAYQIYIKHKNALVFKPEKELKEFGKIFLKKGETKEISISLNKRAFSYFHQQLNDFVVEPGSYEILIGSSSKHLHLKEEIIISGKLVEPPFSQIELPSYYNLSFKEDEFRKIMGGTLPSLNEITKRPYTMNHTISEIRHTLVGRILVRAGLKEIRKTTKDIMTQKMMEKSFLHLPLRSVVTFSGDKITMPMAKGLLLMINRRYIKGLCTILRKKK